MVCVAKSRGNISIIGVEIAADACWRVCLLPLDGAQDVPGRTDCHVAGRGHGGDVMCGCNASSVHAGCVPGGI